MTISQQAIETMIDQALAETLAPLGECWEPETLEDVQAVLNSAEWIGGVL